MPKQFSILPISGSMQRLTFYKSASGFLVKERTRLNRNLLMEDPAFARTREAMAEFGSAASAAGLIRTAFKHSLSKDLPADSVPRLTAVLKKVLLQDTTNQPGDRNPTDGDLSMLQGFEFNRQWPLNVQLLNHIEAAIDRATGVMTVHLRELVPRWTITAPRGTTDFVVTVTGAEIDFKGRTQESDTRNTGYLRYDSEILAARSFECRVTPESQSSLFLGIGMEYYKSINGRFFSLGNSRYAALRLIKVDV